MSKSLLNEPVIIPSTKKHSRYFTAHRKFTKTWREPLEHGPCALCGKDAVLVQDHCHETGLNRGRVCIRCNAALGQFEHIDTKLLAAYVAEWRAEHKTNGGVEYKPGVKVS